jgi:three-Cys-motif partner protein
MSDASPLKDQQFLFDPSEFPPLDDVPVEPNIRTIDRPVWTDNKAHFIMRYLRYFVFITKHGTYIDGFAGPQEERMCDTWAARLVLESEPRWMRHFYLCDDKRSQVALLEQLKAAQPVVYASGGKIPRDITVYHGDFNDKLDEILSAADITEREATFCLLDQRTFECHWATLEKLAKYKASGHKIEIFYFLANGWLERALAAQKDLDVLARWWGRDDWTELRAMSRDERRDVLVGRFKRDLGYQSVKAWPIYERENGGAVMYYMIHATDHPEAPKLMSRAYRNTVSPLEPIEQLDLGLFPESKGAVASVTASQKQPQLRRII